MLRKRIRGYSRAEAAQTAASSALRWVDPEPRGLDQALSLPVGMAAAHDARPGGLDEVLATGAPGDERAHVLQHPQVAGRTQDAPHLGEAAGGVGDTAEGEAARDRVEDAVAKRERLRPGGDHRDCRRPAPGAPERGEGWVDGDDERARRE